ncbi:MAG TPA: cupin domain-containing protein [Desulfobaccales bacterium]|nr:cupin domain-containing protein [Desulfobaccales bacterium]
MKNIDLQEINQFKADKPYRELLYDSPNLRVLAFNFEPGQELPVHSHPADSDVILMVLEGEGEFTGGNPMPAKAGQIQIMPVCEPHGLKAWTRMRLLVLIAPTL